MGRGRAAPGKEKSPNFPRKPNSVTNGVRRTRFGRGILVIRQSRVGES